MSWCLIAALSQLRVGAADLCDANADGFARFVLVYVAVSWIIPVSLVFLVLQALAGFMVFLPTNAMILERVHERDLSNMQCAAAQPFPSPA